MSWQCPTCDDDHPGRFLFCPVSGHHRHWSRDALSEALAEANPDALLFDGFEDALIGIARQQHKRPLAVYDRAKCLQILQERDGMVPEDAELCFSFNTEGAWVGENTPLVLVR